MAFTPIEWPVDSRVTLCRVTWDSSYRDVVRFADIAERDAYFAGLSSNVIRIENMTYLKPNEPIMVNVPYSQAYTYNYIVVENPELPIEGEVTPPRLFYFITGVAFVAPNTTALTLQLDVFQTYIYGAEFGRCYLERGHIDFYLNGEPDTINVSTLRDSLTLPEGLDIGSEYQISSHTWMNMAPAAIDSWAVVLLTTVDLTAAWGNKTNPSLATATGQRMDGVVGGCNCYMMTPNAFVAFMGAVSTAPWVSKGIISISCFPRKFLTQGEQVDLDGGNRTGLGVYKLGNTPDIALDTDTVTVAAHLAKSLPAKYRKLAKFYTYPYSVIELNTFNGSPTMLKPEMLSQARLGLNATACATPGNMRVALYPEAYGEGSNAETYTYSYASLETPFSPNGETWPTATIKGSYFLDVAAWLDNFPQLSMVNDGYLNYLASTTHTRAWSYQSAGWTKDRANTSAEYSYKNATLQAQTTRENWTRSHMLEQAGGNFMDFVSNNWNGLVSDVSQMDAGAGWLMGGLGGLADMAGNALTAALGQQTSVTDAVNNLTGLSQANATYDTANTVAGNNLALANYAAQGDYENEIARINATVQDAALTQPSTSGQMGGNAFMLSNGLIGVDIRYRTLNPTYAKVIGEYWYRYGYAVRRFVKPPTDLHCMSRFTYWKMAETYLTCALGDETSKAAIRGIFEKGVTVWRNPDDIGTIDIADNTYTGNPGGYFL